MSSEISKAMEKLHEDIRKDYMPRESIDLRLQRINENVEEVRQMLREQREGLSREIASQIMAWAGKDQE